MGRPTDLTPAVANDIVATLQLGLSIVDACRASGITDRTYQNWVTRGKRAAAARKMKPEDEPFLLFFQGVEKARALGKLANIQTVSNASKGNGVTPGDWKAAAWLLERQYPREFGRKYIRIETGDGQPGDPAALPPPAPTVNVIIEGGSDPALPVVEEPEEPEEEPQ